MPAYDPRAVQGIGVAYATTTQGADHTAGYAVTANLLSVGGDVDALKPVGQMELARNLQVATAILTDATGMCLFIAFAVLDQPDTFQALVDLINAFTGENFTGDDLTVQGKAILKCERDFNFRAGFTEKDDRLPEYFKKEPLPPHNVTFQVSDEDLDQVHNF
jgi:aldehyde:ferredoxin oxidoreductase